MAQPQVVSGGTGNEGWVVTGRFVLSVGSNYRVIFCVLGIKCYIDCSGEYYEINFKMKIPF